MFYYMLYIFIKHVINLEAAKRSEATFEDSKWGGGVTFCERSEQPAQIWEFLECIRHRQILGKVSIWKIESPHNFVKLMSQVGIDLDITDKYDIFRTQYTFLVSVPKLWCSSSSVPKFRWALLNLYLFYFFINKI